MQRELLLERQRRRPLLQAPPLPGGVLGRVDELGDTRGAADRAVVGRGGRRAAHRQQRRALCRLRGPDVVDGDGPAREVALALLPVLDGVVRRVDHPERRVHGDPQLPAAALETARQAHRKALAVAVGEDHVRLGAEPPRVVFGLGQVGRVVDAHLLHRFEPLVLLPALRLVVRLRVGDVGLENQRRLREHDAVDVRRLPGRERALPHHLVAPRPLPHAAAPGRVLEEAEGAGDREPVLEHKGLVDVELVPER